MTLGSKVMLGLLSLSPIIFIGVVLFWRLPSFSMGSDPVHLIMFRSRFSRLVPFAIAASVVVLVLVFVYAVILARRPDLPVIEKRL